MNDGAATGGCQCGAIRYRAECLGRSSVCHCRMCQRAVGNVSAPLVIATGIVWQGTPATWASSNISERGFCSTCGTPLFLRDFEAPDGECEIMIATLDDPELAPPAYHVGVESRISWVKLADGLPVYETGGTDGAGPKTITSNQYPIHRQVRETR